MAERIPLLPEWRADDSDEDEIRSDHTHEVMPDVAYKRTVFVNHAYVGHSAAEDRAWFLIDAGLTQLSARTIKRAASERFSEGARPSMILLTHGHFDHIGAARQLSEEWDCPIYAHALELPFLSGDEKYPDPDPSVGGGLMALMSPLYPKGPFDAGLNLRPLPANGEVPGHPEWRWILVPGHAPGQVAFWREADRILIAGDAFVTTDQESIYAALTQKYELGGPPQYFTPDWLAARDSVRKLAALEPNVVITGHGRAMEGAEMRDRLHYLADNFDRIAVPEHGKYVDAEVDSPYLG